MIPIETFADAKYQKFFSRLVCGSPVIGVRKQGVLQFLKSMSFQEKEAFLRALPHRWTEENQAHMYLLNTIKDFPAARAMLLSFLPYISTWAVSDILNIRAFGPDVQTESFALELLASSYDYGPRTGLLILKRHFLPAHPHLKEVLQVNTRIVHNSQMVAWYLAELAIAEPETVEMLLDQLDVPTIRRTIQKIVDSRRIKDDIKARFKAKRPSKSAR